MAIRQEDLTPDQRAELDARRRSWEVGQRALKDPVVRDRLDDALRKLDEEPQLPSMPPAEFFDRATRLAE